MICSANSNIGMKRSVNQDSFVLKTYSEKTCLCVVCDGMGGAKGGCEASKIASDRFAASIDGFIKPYIGRKDKQLRSTEIKEALYSATVAANEAVYSYALSHPSLKGMGTTLVAALIIDKTVFCVNVGDSRMYFAKGSKIKQITKDHSYVQYLLDMGELTAQEAQNFPNKNVITRAIGTEESVRPDVFKETVMEGTFVILCSDGLTNFVPDDEIREIVTYGEARRIDQVGLSLRIKKLIDTANKNGGADNITALVVKL